MPVDSLLDMARRACVRNVHRITDIGDIDYDLIRPILLKIESPEKLHQLELSSPQIIGHDAEIWLNFIKRDIPDWDLKRHEPSNPKNWYKVYKKLKAEATKDSSNDEAMLKAALADIQKGKEQNTAVIASTALSAGLLSSSNASGPSRRARIQWNYISGKTGAKGSSKMTLMEKIRKEARDAKAGKMNRPMHELQKKQTGVVKAPAQFVEEVKKMKIVQATEAKKALSPPLKRPVSGTGASGNAGISRPLMFAPSTQIPKPRPQPAVAGGGKPYDLTSDRESRLRALKSGRPISRVDPETYEISQAQASTSNSARDLQSPLNSAQLNSQKRKNGTVPGNSRGVEDTNGSLTLDFLEDSDGDDIQDQPRRTRESVENKVETPRKLLKPNNALASELPPRSRSPLKLSPAPGSRPLGSQSVKRKYEAPNLFYTAPNKRPKPV
ncbi:hypothetical protein AYO21_11308 [Fonsecaea monophora]|uniref:Elongin-A n=1 Tax=Fonsecaea monophora TaxID=254056 RepID=A0A177ESA5_9EURO|nr:hypothetical protein AYO21_11308 [Fonsecaea monophora]KAH0829376.1 hypothetical protein FOPE_10400 [Fonsecaea pedrosoi]OAG34526.1 hypothetical protein AYO21_11308 [Fonsecaea monophora]